MEIDKLFKLINTLTGTEKRYFSIWSTRHYGQEKNIALQLFNDLQKRKHYDQKEFLSKNAHRAYAKNFRFNKHFLFNQILRCLHAFHSGRNTESKLKEMQDHADILSEKGLDTESLKILEQAAKLALKYECFGIYYEVKRKELELIRDSAYKGITRDKIKQIEKDIHQTIKRADALTHTESSIMQLLQTLAQGGIHRGELLEQTKKLMRELDPKHSDYFRERLLYYQGKSAVEFSKGNFKEAIKYTREVIELFERFPHMKAEKKKTYMIAVQNHLVASNYMDRYEELEDTMSALQNIKADSPQLRNRAFYITHNMMLGTCAHVGDFARGLKLIREIKAAHKTGAVQHLNLQNELIFHFNSALVYFGTGRYREANANLQKIMNQEQVPLREDLQSFSRIFNIIIQFESGKQDLLEYSVRSAYRFLLKKKKLFEVEKVVIRFIRNSAHQMNTSKERLEAFRKLRKELLALKGKKKEEQSFRFFDLIAWLDSKLSGTYFALILQEKYPSYWKN